METSSSTSAARLEDSKATVEAINTRLEQPMTSNHGHGQMRASHISNLSQVASGSYGGFVVSTCTHVAFVLYLLWAFLPDSVIQALGISWYPHRDWALLLPSWLTMLVVSVYVGYAALNIYDTPSLDSPAHITDAYALIQNPPVENQMHPLVANSAVALAEDAIPVLYDMPIAMYNQIAFDDI